MLSSPQSGHLKSLSVAGGLDSTSSNHDGRGSSTPGSTAGGQFKEEPITSQVDLAGRMRRSSEPTGVEQDRMSTASGDHSVGPSPLAARDFRDSRVNDIVSRAASNSSPPPPPPDRATTGWSCLI